MQLLMPMEPPLTGWVSRAPGLVFLSVGLWLSVWAVKTVADIDVDKPECLVTSGPYKYSRNPMYVAWDAIYIGISLVANMAWPVLLLPAALLWNHVQIVQEERVLTRQFGVQYRNYRSKTRRYL
jgi:protein-S-isoprenylcysteine O-methyltransferase Ste14